MRIDIANAIAWAGQVEVYLGIRFAERRRRTERYRLAESYTVGIKDPCGKFGIMVTCATGIFAPRMGSHISKNEDRDPIMFVGEKRPGVGESQAPSA